VERAAGCPIRYSILHFQALAIQILDR
jgi:hypothetical protein